MSLTPPATPPRITTPVKSPEAPNLTALATPSKTNPIQDFDRLASEVLDIIQHYGQHLKSTDDAEHSGGWLGKSLFKNQVKAQLEKSQEVRLIIPAFPWKSANKVQKVMGILPDLGEELALYRLNEMCEDIKKAYPIGGTVFIATDGLVFDDIVGIPEEETWAYGEGLIEMVRKHGLKNIKLTRVMDILGYTEGKTVDKELYLSLTKKCRDELLSSYGRTESEVRQMIKEYPDTLLTYCGFIRFLEADLKFSPVTAATKAISGTQYRKTVKKVAIQMMIRAESFTKLLQAHCTEYVRLSIHPSTGAVKLSFPLIIQASENFPRSPWHSSLAVSINGSYSTVLSQDVRESHDLIMKDGRGYYFREKSSQWDFEDDEIVCEPRYPNLLIVRPSRVELLGIKLLSAKQLQNLATLKASHTAGTVIVTGFAASTH